MSEQENPKRVADLPDDDQLARELAKVQKQITGLDDSLDTSDQSDGNSDAEHGQAPSFATDSNSDNSEMREKLDSAKKVMQLLAQMRPNQASRLNETLVEPDTFDGSTFEKGQPPLEPQFPTNTFSDGKTPSTIGRFQIEKLLGQGGFGLVFLARDPSLDRLVALKVPTFNTLMTDGSQARFAKEGRVLAALSHPNIVPIFEVGNEGPISFIASEYVPGTDLAKWVTEYGPLPPLLAAQTMLVVADAIQHAHSRDVVHRDLKPSNILLETNSEQSAFDPDSSRVVDFGLAKLLAETDEAITRTGNVIGTPAFSAPEQLRPCTETQTNRSADIYSLGATLYHLVTGKAPFSASSVVEMISKVQSQSPLVPRKLNAEIPADLSAICMKCLEKSPADRYATIHDARSDLQRFINGQPVVARPLPAWQRCLKWCRRNPTVSALATIAVLAVVIGLAASLWSARNADIAAERSRQQYIESKKVIDEYYVQVTQNPMFKSAAYRDVKIELLNSAQKHYQEFLQDNANDEDLVADLILTKLRIAELQFFLGEQEEAKLAYEATLEMIDLELDSSWTETMLQMKGMCLAGLGSIETKLGQPEPAQAFLDSANEIFETLLAADPHDQDLALEAVETWQATVHNYRLSNDFQQANQYSQKQQTFLDAFAEHQPLNSTLDCHYAMSLGDQAQYARDQRQYARAIELLDESVRRLENLIETETNPVWFAEKAIGSYYRRGVVNFYMGRFEQVQANAERANELADSLILINRRPDFQNQRIGVKDLMVIGHQRLGRSKEAAQLNAEILADSRKLADDFPNQVRFQSSLAGRLLNHTVTQTDEMNLGAANSTWLELDQLLSKLHKARAGGPTILPLRIEALNAKGRILHREKSFDEAIIQFDSALQLFLDQDESTRQLPPLTRALQSIHENRSFSLSQVGRHEEAIADRREVTRLSRTGDGTYNQLTLAQMLARAGRTQECLEILETHQANVAEDAKLNGFYMKQAFARGYIAVALQKEQDVADEDSKEALQSEIETQLQLAESLILKAVDRGYFAKQPSQIFGIDLRAELRPILFDRPNIKPILDEQRRIWTNTR